MEQAQQPDWRNFGRPFASLAVGLRPELALPAVERLAVVSSHEAFVKLAAPEELLPESVTLSLEQMPARKRLCLGVGDLPVAYSFAVDRPAAGLLAYDPLRGVRPVDGRRSLVETTDSNSQRETVPTRPIAARDCDLRPRDREAECRNVFLHCWSRWCEQSQQSFSGRR